MNNVDNLHGYIATKFHSIAPFMNKLLICLQPSIVAYNDINYLRNKHILNPIEYDMNNKISQLSNFANFTLDGTLSIYPELIDGASYNEYVIYVIIMCPSLIFDVNIQGLLKNCMTQGIFISIYRDVVS